MTTTQRQTQQRGKYRELIGIAEEVIESARMALRRTAKARGKDTIAELAAAEIRKEIEHFCSLGDRVIDQSRRRVLNGEQVPTAEKIFRFSSPIPTLSSAARCRRRSSSATRSSSPKARAA